jgi:hypothetical protein
MCILFYLVFLPIIYCIVFKPVSKCWHRPSPTPLPTPPHFLENYFVDFIIYWPGVGVTYIYAHQKIRIRKHTYEVLVDLIYRLEINILKKKKEFGPLQHDTLQALNNLLGAARTAKTVLERNCLLNEGFTARSKELNAVLNAIDALSEAGVIVIHPDKRVPVPEMV